MIAVRRDVEPHELQPGEYGLCRGVWYAMTPDGRLACLVKHHIEVHESGAISVHPSILVRGGGQPGEWHGWLKHGEWRL